MAVNPITLWELLFTSEFQVGFLAGAGALVVGLALRRWEPDWGVLWALAAVAGAWVIGFANLRTLERVVGTYSWANIGALLSIAAAAIGISLARDRKGLPLAVGLTVGAVWSTVPDTESISLLMGVTASLLWIWWPRSRIEIGTLGAVLVPALIMATALLGGAPRPSGLMGSIGVIGALLVFSIGRPANVVIDVVIHVLVVLGWSRVAGLSGSAQAAFAIGVVVTVLGVAAKLLAPLALDRWKRQGDAPDSAG